MTSKLPSFWQWLFRGTTGRAGWRKFLNSWLLLHVGLGWAIATLVQVSLREAANAVLLPLAGIFVGLSFAWAGNAQALLQSKEIETFSQFHEGGFEEYAFTFQAAILTILSTLVVWGIAGLGVYERRCFWQCGVYVYRVAEVVLYSLASLTLRECWQVVLGSQWMLLVQRGMKQRDER